jgi:hypothetical protein
VFIIISACIATPELVAVRLLPSFLAPLYIYGTFYIYGAIIMVIISFSFFFKNPSTLATRISPFLKKFPLFPA